MKTKFFSPIVVAGLVALNLSGCMSGSTAAPPAQENIVKLKADIAQIASDPAHPLASLSVAAVRDGMIVYQGQFGNRFIDANNPANNKPATVDTMYRIASISKMVTALGALKLVEENKLNLDADISQYLGFNARNPAFPNDMVTTRMLLSHTSSLRDDGGYSWDQTVTMKEVLVPGGKQYGTGAMWASGYKPGAYFNYVNLNWTIIGSVMEAASGERFDKLMQRAILAPMGVRGGFNPADLPAEDLANLATLYRKRNAQEVWNVNGPWVPQVDDYSINAPVPRGNASYKLGDNGSLYSPAGGLRISALDLAKIMLMLINEGTYNGKEILKPQSVKNLLAQQWRYAAGGANGDNNFGGGKELFNAWGLGTQIFLDVSKPSAGDRLVEQGNYKAYGHLGDAYGLTSAMVFDPLTKSGMVLMTGGPGFNPDSYPGSYSALYKHEEKILTALYKRAILGDAK
jgi:CubicO group peptidase (beta-lactamase class C family)